MHLGELANRVARRHCGAQHQGAMPCDECAAIRAIVVEAIGEFLGELTSEVMRNAS